MKENDLFDRLKPVCENFCSTTSSSYKQRSLRFLSGTILVVFHRKHLAARRTAGKLLPLSQIDNVSEPQLAYLKNIQIGNTYPALTHITIASMPMNVTSAL